MNKTFKSVTPVATLVEELKSDDPKRRVNSVKSLSLIANVIGTDRTRSELIPFVNELLDDDEEILVELAESLGELSGYLGGNQYAHLLLSPLEKLCYVEESTVRDKAAEAIKRVVNLIDFKKYEDILTQFVRKLSSSDHVLAKEAACAIIPSVYPISSPQFQNELSQTYYKLCNDGSSEVRKFGSLNLKDLAKFMTNNNETDILNCVRILMKDDQDFVKLYIMDTLVVLAQVSNPQKHQNNVLVFLKPLAEDPSWRIRYTVADKIPDLAKILGKQQSKAVLLPFFVKFLQDPESEMKTIAALRLGKFVEYIDEIDAIQRIVPCLNALAKDPLSHVRTSLAESLLSICPIIGKKGTNDHILQLFLMLLRDEVPEVRVNLFKHLDDLTRVIDIDSLSQSLLPALNELSNDKNWRTRISAVEFLPFFAKKMGEEFLNDRFAKLLIDSLSDKVFCVREAAIQSVKGLIEALGSQWAERQLIPKILIFQGNSNYLYRMNIVFIIQQVATLLTPETLSKSIVSSLILLSKDIVPNIRLNAAKALKIVIPLLKDKSADMCKKALNQMTEDTDPDVKYIAKCA